MAEPVFTDQFLDRMRCTGDPPMDRLVADLPEPGRLLTELHRMRRLDPGALARLERDGLIDTRIVELFDPRNSLPDWLDTDKLLLGGNFFREHGMLCLLLLATASLPACYCWRPVSEVLGFTGRLQREVPRRLPETAQMVVDVESPVDLRSQRPYEHLGVFAVHKVRLMHAIIRRLILTGKRDATTGPNTGMDQAYLEADWEHEHAVPISQEDLAAVLLTFHFVVLRGLGRLGVRIPAATREAYLHRWNVIGYVLGIDEEILLKLDSMDAAAALYEDMMRRRRAPSPDAAGLQRALIGYMQNNIIERLAGIRLHTVRHVPPILTRWLAGKRIARTVQLELSLAEKLLYLPVCAFFGTAGFFSSWGPTRRISQWLWRFTVANVWDLRSGGPALEAKPVEDEEPDRAVEIPAHLLDDWHLNPGARGSTG